VTTPRLDLIRPTVIPLLGGVTITGYGAGFSGLTQVSLRSGNSEHSTGQLVIIDDATMSFQSSWNLAAGQYQVILYASSTRVATGINITYQNPIPFDSNAIPPGRGRWRLTLHNRQFTGVDWKTTIIAELTNARGRRLEQKWNAPAQLTFTLDGHDPVAPLVLELATDVIAWRWDETLAEDCAMFRGIIDHSEDQITEQSATVTFTAHDYLAMLQRRLVTTTYSFSQYDQDTIANYLISMAKTIASSSGTLLSPGNYLPLTLQLCNPDGTNRSAASGQLRDRTYYPSTNLGTAFDDLSKVINGFDYDVYPGAGIGNGAAQDEVRLFYPNQGISRPDVPLMYGATISTLTRTVNSGDYANYTRVVGNNGSSDPNAPQLYSEQWNNDATAVTVNPVGLWMYADNAADVTIQSTLDQKAAGDLNFMGILVPSYTVTMTPGAYHYTYPDMGDICPLIVIAGRLNVNTTVRVLGISYDVSDDGDEIVSLTLGRPASTLVDLFTQADRDVDALTRR
jgi:hypothetical protein